MGLMSPKEKKATLAVFPPFSISDKMPALLRQPHVRDFRLWSSSRTDERRMPSGWTPMQYRWMILWMREKKCCASEQAFSPRRTLRVWCFCGIAAWFLCGGVFRLMDHCICSSGERDWDQFGALFWWVCPCRRIQVFRSIPWLHLQ